MWGESGLRAGGGARKKNDRLPKSITKLVVRSICHRSFFGSFISLFGTYEIKGLTTSEWAILKLSSKLPLYDVNFNSKSL